MGSLFSGIGGIDLGLERAGMRVKWQVEIDPFCQRILTRHWPDVPLYGDIRELPGTELKPVDLVCGGFPCQDVSWAAYRREGFAGERTGLFWELIRLVRVLRPKFILLENVPGIVDDGLPEILGELAILGYDAEWEMLQANWFGLPHVRKRWFLIAYPMRFRRGVFEPVYRSLSQDVEHGLKDQNILSPRCAWNTPEGLADHLRKDDGISRMVDQNRLRVLGNAVAPPIAEWIGRRIMNFQEGD